MTEALTEQMMYEIISKSTFLDIRAKAVFRTPPYHCRYLESSYKPGGAMYREEHEDDY